MDKYIIAIFIITVIVTAVMVHGKNKAKKSATKKGTGNPTKPVGGGSKKEKFEM